MRWFVLRRTQIALALCCIFLFIFLQFPIVASTDIQDDIRYGPFLDKAIFKVIVGQHQRTLALQGGVIDIGNIGLSSLNTLDADPDIDIYESPRNGYASVYINSDRYPLNISGFRRAFAFAFNKTKAIYDVYEGHASLHDSLVPSTNRWCAEDLFDYHYYEAEPERGNALLDELGFTINNETGFRDAPNGDSFSVQGFYFQPPKLWQVAADALHSLHIDTTWYYYGWFPMPWVPPPTWGMITGSMSFEYDNLDVGLDLTNFRNDTYDFWMDKFNNGKTYEEVYEASTEIQKILHYNVPILVACQNSYLQGYRNDTFQGHVGDITRYFSGPWTMRRMHRINGEPGGMAYIALGYEIDTFNFYTTTSPYSRMILENLYSSLYSRGPDMNPIPDLVESMLVETHSDNPSIPDGHTRFTFDILKHGQWSDGVPLTAEDIAFTFIYLLESKAYGNPAADILSDLVSVYSPTTYQVVMEFSTESYWHFYNIAYEFIIPKHIFTTIGYSGWNTWNPVLDVEEPHVTSGPFVLTDLEPGEFYELSQNPSYHWHQPDVPLPPPNVNNTSTTTATPFPVFDILPIVATASTVVIVGVMLLLIRERKYSD